MEPGGLLEHARASAGLTQDELARRAGTSRPTLSAYENGRKSPTVATFARLLSEAGGISAGRVSSPARAAPDDTASEDLDFFTVPDRGYVPAARDVLEAAARDRGWATERIHDSDTFCRLVIRSDTAEVVTDLAV